MLVRDRGKAWFQLTFVWRITHHLLVQVVLRVHSMLGVSKSYHLAEAFTVSCDVVAIVLKLGKSTVKSQLTCHLLSQEKRPFSQFEWLLSCITVVFWVVFLLCSDEGLPSDFLVKCFLQLVQVSPQLEHPLITLVAKVKKFVEQSEFKFRSRCLWPVFSNRLTFNQRHEFLQFLFNDSFKLLEVTADLVKIVFQLTGSSFFIPSHCVVCTLSHKLVPHTATTSLHCMKLVPDQRNLLSETFNFLHHSLILLKRISDAFLDRLGLLIEITLILAHESFETMNFFFDGKVNSIQLRFRRQIFATFSQWCQLLLHVPNIDLQ